MIINMTKPTIIRVEDDSFFRRGRMMQTSPLRLPLAARGLLAPEEKAPVGLFWIS
jgi:hypothetical protein